MIKSCFANWTMNYSWLISPKLNLSCLCIWWCFDLLLLNSFYFCVGWLFWLQCFLCIAMCCRCVALWSCFFMFVWLVAFASSQPFSDCTQPYSTFFQPSLSLYSAFRSLCSPFRPLCASLRSAGTTNATPALLHSKTTVASYHVRVMIMCGSVIHMLSHNWLRLRHVFQIQRTNIWCEFSMEYMQHHSCLAVEVWACVILPCKWRISICMVV